MVIYRTMRPSSPGLAGRSSGKTDLTIVRMQSLSEENEGLLPAVGQTDSEYEKL